MSGNLIKPNAYSVFRRTTVKEVKTLNVNLKFLFLKNLFEQTSRIKNASVKSIVKLNQYKKSFIFYLLFLLLNPITNFYLR
ncbi:hypothetical protein A2999_00305 [Candidatus Wolfebacteria bacterium RIFCSPLOWO2_01_FULL_38_11]|uniref:Uncharacterized protein n=1 Tax=Candidatus Wolfebacteria bacterium RIFCSPLOWO2_01_FULL_38_11 TaxID=1802556 RepID=A0A1F8DPR9_9BACT|nr:MAG: hypothetical protein A2999_00305 [Candidatus Wolfebacteria bacterium RIFCSPLOWO2_01_FULL_38_11]